jgi:hypothetical protein
MSNAQIETHVNGLGNIFYCNDSAFDDASYAVFKKSDELISSRDLAYGRIVDAKANDSWKNSSLCTTGSYVREGSLFVPNADDKRIWLRESLVLQNPTDAVKAHKNGNEYVPKNFKVGEYLEQIGKDNYFIVSDVSSIPTDRFGEDARTVWAFKDQAKEYGTFLKESGINAINIWMYNTDDKHINSQSGPFANQLWLLRLDDNSDIIGGNRDLSCNNRVRGVRRESAEGSALKNMYSREDIVSRLHKVGVLVSGSDFEKLVLKEFDR